MGWRKVPPSTGRPHCMHAWAMLMPATHASNGEGEGGGEQCHTVPCMQLLMLACTVAVPCMQLLTHGNRAQVFMHAAAHAMQYVPAVHDMTQQCMVRNSSAWQ